jgi:hypothetical protein
MSAATLDDIAALLTVQNRLLERLLDGSLGVVTPEQPMGTISQCVPPSLCGDELHAFLRARNAEKRAAARRGARR